MARRQTDGERMRQPSPVTGERTFIVCCINRFLQGQVLAATSVGCGDCVRLRMTRFRSRSKRQIKPLAWCRASAIATDQAAHNRHSERLPQFGAVTGPERQRQRAEQRSDGGHDIDRKRNRRQGKMACCGSSLTPLVSMATSIIMIALFLTMPISRITPINAVRLNSILNIINASTAPTPAEGSVAENGDRMHQTLVEHAEAPDRW